VPLTIAEIERWSAGSMRDVAYAAQARATACFDAAAGLGRLPAFQTWGGDGAEAAGAAIDKARLDLNSHGDEAMTVARAADVAAAGIEKVQADLRALIDHARSVQIEIDPATDTIRTVPGFKGSAQQAAAIISALQTQLAAVIGEATGVDAELANAIAMSTGKIPIPAAPPPQPLPPLPSKDAKPEDVRKWWDSLSQGDKDRFTAQHPQDLGNLNGIPATVRDQVNQAVMTGDINRVTDTAARNGVGVDDVVKRPEAYGLTPTDVTRYTNAVQTKKGLDIDRGSPANPRPAMLWAYDPLASEGKGNAAIAIGNPDYAQKTAVIVGGLGSSVHSGFLSNQDARNLYDQTLAADPRHYTSVMAWMGYDAPNSWQDPRTLSPWLARQGGEQLAADVNGLWMTHSGPTPQHITVIGHSYGSTTVADAFAASGMHANDAVLIGSPGTDLAHSAADFHLDGGHVYVGSASTDPVTYIGEMGWLPQNWLNGQLGYPAGPLAGLGTDPAGDGFGSIRFHAEVPGSTDPTLHDHSYYYHWGSEALRSMTDIAGANPGALATDGLLAQGRHQPHFTTPSEVNIPGFGEVQIPHIDTRIPGTPDSVDPEATRLPESITDRHAYPNNP
jgi:hypothetical protein